MKYTKIPFRLDNHGIAIWCKSAKGGERKVIDLRGWGYLSGKGNGALGLSHEEAIAEQKAVGAFVVDACNSYNSMKDLLESPPIISKYHGANGFESEKFIADYENWRKKVNKFLSPVNDKKKTKKYRPGKDCPVCGELYPQPYEEGDKCIFCGH